MKTFKEFMIEVGGYYHNAWRGSHPLSNDPSPISWERAENTKPHERPIWLSNDAHTARGWKKHMSAKKSYHVEVEGDVAHHHDENIQKLFKKHRIDMKRYNHMLFGQPDAKTVHSHPATKLLKKKGYVGYTHPERDPHTPRDWSFKTSSTVIFHRKHVKIGPEIEL